MRSDKSVVVHPWLRWVAMLAILVMAGCGPDRAYTCQRTRHRNCDSWGCDSATGEGTQTVTVYASSQSDAVSECRQCSGWTCSYDCTCSAAE